MKTREVLLAGLSDRLGLHRDALAGNAARPKARGRGSPPISWRAGRHLMEWRFVRRSTIGIQDGASKQLWIGSGRLPAPSPFAVAADLLFPEPNPFLRDPVWVRYWILARLPLVGPAPYGQSVARQPLQRIRGIASASDPATLPWLRGAARTPPQNGRITRPTSPNRLHRGSRTYPSSSMLARPVRLAATTKPQQCLRIARPTARDCLPKIRTASVFVQHPRPAESRRVHQPPVSYFHKRG